MTTALQPEVTTPVRSGHPPLARRPGFFRDLATVATRALRQARRDPVALVPQIFVPLFFFTVLVGSLEDFVGPAIDGDFRAFQLPLAVVIAVTGVARAVAVVTDITSGYFDRMLLAPSNRFALLLGLMVADLVIVLITAGFVVGLGFAVGVRFATGAAGVAVFIGLSALWSLAYVGILYAAAFKFANPTIMAQTFLLFFPFVFLTTAIVPQDLMTGWLSTVADINPLTYVLEAMRELIVTGWDGRTLLEALIAIGIVAVASHTMALAALRGRAARR